MSDTEDITILKELDDRGEGRRNFLWRKPPGQLPVTHRGILDAIRKEPNEPVHRMALADWLTDQGEFEPRYDDERHRNELARLREVALTGVLKAERRTVFFCGPDLCTRYGVTRIELADAAPLFESELRPSGRSWFGWRGVMIEDLERPSDLPMHWMSGQDLSDWDNHPWIFTRHQTHDEAMEYACKRALSWCLANTEEARTDRARQRVAEQVAKAMVERAERRYRSAARGGR